MPLRLISNFVSSFLKKNDQTSNETPKEILATSASQKSSSLASISFSPTITIQGLWNKKDDLSDVTTIKSTAETEKWIAHQEQLEFWKQQPPIFDPYPSFGIQDYELIETLVWISEKRDTGTGTFGRVWLTKQRKTKKYYAIKVLKKANIVKLKQVEHINSERQVLSEINFPFIVQLYCTFQDYENLFMLQEYVIGGELFRHLRKSGRFPNDTARFYAAEIVLALEYLHSKDIIYRDLKPENILLDHRGYIKITDFGFAKKVIDRTWTLCGTPEYLAPEIIQSKGHSKSVDWWSLGILIFEMMAGYPPFYDDNHFGIYEHILGGKVQYPSYFENSARDLLKKLLVIDRTKRLGNLKGGADDIKKHKWFRTTDWHGLLTKTVRAPLIPAHSNDYDTSNFDKYPDEISREQPKDDPFRELFSDF
ncbi:camp-dependent protein kinase 10 [Parasitella parasitica]|nr:camp-dependent protein kinase 10 [Parasitella parasitica]